MQWRGHGVALSMRRWEPRRPALVNARPRAVTLALSVALGLAVSLALVVYLGFAAPAPMPRIVATQVEPGATVEFPAPAAPVPRASTVPVTATTPPVSLAAAVPAPAVLSPLPVLEGVVLKGELAIAYFEDPVTKRVKGYRVGESIAGATVQAITADRVVLAHAGGLVTARLGQTTRPEPVVSPQTVAGTSRPAREKTPSPSGGARPDPAGVPAAAGGNPTVVSPQRQAIEERLLPARRRMLLEALLAAKPGDVVQAP